MQWLASRSGDVSIRRPVSLVALPARHLWDAEFLRDAAPDLIVEADRPDPPPTHFVWSTDRGQAGQFIHGFHSTWLPAGLIEAHREGQDATGFAVYEQWRSLADLDRHLRTPYVTRLRDRLSRVMEGEPEFRVLLPAGEATAGL
jgi:Antibiotic biosynthesis monooxygenase